VTHNPSRHLRAVRSKRKIRIVWRYWQVLVVRAYRSLCLRYWLWNGRKILARLRSVGVAPGHLSSLQRIETEQCPRNEGSPLIAKVDEDVQFQGLLSADSRGFIKTATGERFPLEQELRKDSERNAPAERQRRWIAEYDTYFLASMRIQFTGGVPTTESPLNFLGDSTRDSSAVERPGT